MRDKRKASATRDGSGFKVRIPRINSTDYYELYVHDNGKIDGLPGSAEEDRVLVYLVEGEVRAEGWPSVGRAALRRYGLL